MRSVVKHKQKSAVDLGDAVYIEKRLRFKEAASPSRAKVLMYF